MLEGIPLFTNHFRCLAIRIMWFGGMFFAAPMPIIMFHQLSPRYTEQKQDRHTLCIFLTVQNSTGQTMLFFFKS